jgi:hypothetical protein
VISTGDASAVHGWRATGFSTTGITPFTSA